MLAAAEAACEGMDVGLVNARLLCPLGERELRLLDGAECVVTVEDGSRETGFGAQLARLACAEGKMRVITLGVPSVPIGAATPAEQDELSGISAAQIRAAVAEQLGASD